MFVYRLLGSSEGNVSVFTSIGVMSGLVKQTFINYEEEKDFNTFKTGV